MSLSGAKEGGGRLGLGGKLEGGGLGLGGGAGGEKKEGKWWEEEDLEREESRVKNDSKRRRMGRMRGGEWGNEEE